MASEAEQPTGEVPSNANAHCPGTADEAAGKAAACAGCPNQAVCASAPKGAVDPDLALIAERLSSVRHIILVLSGKGGVGKSTFATQLAYCLSHREAEVGILDIDICGPSVPKLVGLEGEEIHRSNTGWSPVYVDERLSVMSIGFLLPKPDDAVIWRGPRKNGLIKQFLKDVDWGELDYLIVDAPPGTSDEHITITQCLTGCSNVAGAVIVTTPQEVSIIDVRKEVNFCKKVGLPVLGVVENMSGLEEPLSSLRFVRTNPQGIPEDVTSAVEAALQPLLGEGAGLDSLAAHLSVFQPTGGGAAKMAADMGVPFLGSIPLDPSLGALGESGASAFAKDSPFMPSRKALERLVDKVTAACGGAANGHAPK